MRHTIDRKKNTIEINKISHKMLFAAALLTATALQQPAKLPTFTTFIADVSSVAETPNGAKQKGHGTSAFVLLIFTIYNIHGRIYSAAPHDSSNQLNM